MSLQPESLSFTPSPYTNKKRLEESPVVESFPTSDKVKEFVAHDHDYLAYIMQVIACVIWTCSYIYSNQNNLDVFEVNLAKGIIGTILNYLVNYFMRSKLRFQQPRIFNGLLHINLCLILYFYALPLSQLYLPLPIVHTVGCSSIAIVYIIDYFVNGVKITKGGVVGILFGILGVVIMSNNRLILSIIDSNYEFDSKFNNYRESSILFSSFIALVLFISRAFNCYGLIKFKQYPEITVFELNYFNNIVGLITGGIGYMTQNKHVSFSVFWPSLISIGIGQFACMTFFFYSLKLTKKTGNVMIINATNIIFAFMISCLRYGQKLNIILIVGSSSLLVSMLIVIVQTKKLKKQAEQQQKQKQNKKNIQNQEQL